MPPSELLLSLLAKRGIVDIDSFLNPSYDEHLHDPLLLSDMDKAVTRFFRALERKNLSRTLIVCTFVYTYARIGT